MSFRTFENQVKQINKKTAKKGHHDEEPAIVRVIFYLVAAVLVVICIGIGAPYDAPSTIPAPPHDGHCTDWEYNYGEWECEGRDLFSK